VAQNPEPCHYLAIVLALISQIVLFLQFFGTTGIELGDLAN